MRATTTRTQTDGRRGGGGGKNGRGGAKADAPQKGTTTQSGRTDAVNQVIGQIEKAHGKGAIMRLGDGPAIQAAQVVSTGSLGLDIALGVGGLPKGRIVEVYGPESSGKTTLALHAIAEAQRTGGICAFIDAEHALDVRYAANLGVDTDELLVTQPDHGEQALEIADMLIRSGAIELIVVDSVAALVPKAELEGEMGDSHVGLHARLMSQAMRKITASAAKHGTMVLFINQLRMKIGVMFGSPETTTGGNALKFYASVRLDVRRIGTIKNGDEVTGNRTRVKVVKNKMAAPFRQVELDLVHGKGIYAAGEVVDMAVEAKRVEKRGSWYSLDGESIGQGRDAAAKYLEEHPEVMALLRGELLAAGGIGTTLSDDGEDTGDHAAAGTGDHAGGDAGDHAGAGTGDHAAAGTGDHAGGDAGDHAGGDMDKGTGDNAGSDTGDDTDDGAGNTVGNEVGKGALAHDGSQEGAPSAREQETRVEVAGVTPAPRRAKAA